MSIDPAQHPIVGRTRDGVEVRQGVRVFPVIGAGDDRIHIAAINEHGRGVAVTSFYPPISIDDCFSTPELAAVEAERIDALPLRSAVS